MAYKVAINGLGRIGRAALKLLMETPDLELVAVNDIGSLENMAYLLRYDSVYRRYERSVETTERALIVGDQRITYLSEPDPARLPWRQLGVDLVFECTGRFTRQEEAAKHIQAGATWVLLSAPTSSADVPTLIHGVNQSSGDQFIVSCASCTTNSITPVMEILHRHFGVKQALLTTIHAYTASQALVDAPSKTKDFRRGRAGAASFVPASTGAAVAATKALPELEGRFDGVAVRGPVPVGSLSDLVLVLARETTVAEINAVLAQEAAGDRYQGILGVADEPLVSSDIVKDSRAAIVQLDMTRVVGGDLVKIMCWYDNEWGFTNQMIRLALETLGQGKTTEKPAIFAEKRRP
jgi:glyceraldehyde 3-phosphate dehydrogenase